MVPGASPRSSSSTAPRSREQVARPLQLLRYPRELPVAPSVLVPDDPCVVQVAATPLARASAMGLDERIAADLSAAASIHPSARVANPPLEEPDAGIPHVRICGSPGGAILRGHPAGARRYTARGAAPIH